MQNFYQTDLAYIHHKDFSKYALEAAHFLKKLIPKGLVVDLGCGSGVFAKAMTEQGFEVIGVDFSEDILHIARQQAPKATFVQASFLEFDIPQCSAITAIGEIINYLFDENNSLDTLYTLFKNCYQQLNLGGYLMFDFIQPNMLEGKERLQRTVEQKDWTIFVEYTEDLTTHRFSRKITLFRKLENGLYRKSKELHLVQLYNYVKIFNMLSEIGFEVKTIQQYGKTPFRKGHIGLICQKK